MNLTEMIGQRMVSGFKGYKMTDEFIQAVKKYKLGNVILFKWNVESAEQLRTLCSDIQELIQAETGHPAFITIDQEGGSVTRMPPDANCVPGAMAVAATGDTENAYQAGLMTAKELRALGINFDLAPVLDVNSNPKNPVIGARSYGDNPENVALFGVKMIKGLLDGGVLSSAKHFPGHGDTAVDSHLGLPVIDKSLETLEACELIPFKAAIRAGIPAVMTTHILFPQIEKEHLPATMSRTIMTGILRERLGFHGLIISDCMMMKAIAEHYGTVNGVVSAMHAGVDLVFVCHDASLASEAMRAVKAACETGTIDIKEMEQSVARILAFKDALPKGTVSAEEIGSAQHKTQIERMMLDAVTLVHGELPPLGDCPIFCGCPAFASSQASNLHPDGEAFPFYMKQKLGGDAFCTTQNPTDQEIADAISHAVGHTAIVFGTVNGILHPAQLKMMRALSSLSCPMVCVSLGAPYDLRDVPDDVCAIAAYQYDKVSLQAIADLLMGLYSPRGILPVRL